jgi:hypothetical protein
MQHDAMERMPDRFDSIDSIRFDSIRFDREAAKQSASDKHAPMQVGLGCDMLAVLRCNVLCSLQHSNTHAPIRFNLRRHDAHGRHFQQLGGAVSPLESTGRGPSITRAAIPFHSR